MASPSSSERPAPRPAALSDAFGQLGLPPRYDVDPAELERAYFERSKELHPDRFASAPAPERVAALSRARALNDAYALLKRDAARAEYLLAQEGVRIGDNERIDPALVMELLEEREALAEARQRGNLDEIQRMAEAMRGRRRAALARVKAGFAQLEAAAAGARAEELARIKNQLILLRYIERYLEECDASLDEC